MNISVSKLFWRICFFNFRGWWNLIAQKFSKVYSPLNKQTLFSLIFVKGLAAAPVHQTFFPQKTFYRKKCAFILDTLRLSHFLKMNSSNGLEKNGEGEGVINFCRLKVLWFFNWKNTSISLVQHFLRFFVLLHFAHFRKRVIYSFSFGDCCPNAWEFFSNWIWKLNGNFSFDFAFS